MADVGVKIIGRCILSCRGMRFDVDRIEGPSRSGSVMEIGLILNWVPDGFELLKIGDPATVCMYADRACKTCLIKIEGVISRFVIGSARSPHHVVIQSNCEVPDRDRRYDEDGDLLLR